MWRRQTKPQRRMPKALNPKKLANKASPRTLVAPLDISSRSGAKNLNSTADQTTQAASSQITGNSSLFLSISPKQPYHTPTTAIQIRLWIFWACHTFHHWRLLCFLLAYPNNPQSCSPKQRAKTRKFNGTLWIPKSPMQWGQPACWGWGHREHMHWELCEWRTPMPFWQTCSPRSCAGLILLPHHRLHILWLIELSTFTWTTTALFHTHQINQSFLLLCLYQVFVQWSLQESGWRSNSAHFFSFAFQVWQLWSIFLPSAVE